MVPKLQEKGFFVVLRQLRTELEVGEKAGENFGAVVMVMMQVVLWRRHSTLGIMVQGLGRQEMVP